MEHLLSRMDRIILSCKLFSSVVTALSAVISLPPLTCVPHEAAVGVSCKHQIALNAQLFHGVE